LATQLIWGGAGETLEPFKGGTILNRPVWRSLTSFRGHERENATGWSSCSSVGTMGVLGVFGGKGRKTIVIGEKKTTKGGGTEDNWETLSPPGGANWNNEL